MNVSDVALLDRWAHQRDAEAFNELVARHASMVYGTSLRIVRNEADAEDVTQACFLELAEGVAGKRRVRVSVGGWLHAAATCRALDYLKAKRRREHREGSFALGTPHTSEQSADDDVQTCVDETILELPEKLRGPLVAHFLEGRSHREIAEMLGIPRTTVTSRIAKGIDQVRQSLQKRGFEITVSALASLLTIESAEAAPLALMAALGKIAIAGGGTAVPSVAVNAIALGGLVMSKKLLIGCAVGLAVLVASLAIFWGQDEAATQRGTVSVAEDTRTRVIEAQPTRPVQSAAVSKVPAEEPVPEPEKEDTAGIEPASPSVKPASVSGHVYDDYGNPFPDATVELQVTSDIVGMSAISVVRVESGTDGAFTFENVTVFGYPFIYASARGFLKECLLVEAQTQLEPGMQRTGLNLILKEAQYYIAGRVVSESGAPVPGAYVNLVHYGYSEATLGGGAPGGISTTGRCTFETTDTRGHFEMAIEQEGLCDFIVTKEGYGPGFFPRIGTGATDVVFRLRAEGAIAGQVTRPDGSPADRVFVCAQGEAVPGGLARTEHPERLRPPAVTVSTEGEGRYLVSGLGGGFDYTVFAHNPISAYKSDSVETHFAGWLVSSRPANWLLTESSPNVANGVRVDAGKTTSGVDLVLSGASCIHGQVKCTQTGAPVYPIIIAACPQGADDPLTEGWLTATDEEGRYSIDLDVYQEVDLEMWYQYTHFAGGSGPPHPAVQSLTSIEPGEDKKVDLIIPGGITVPVRCVDERGHPRTDIFVALRKNPESGSGRSGRLKVGPDGRVTVLGLPPTNFSKSSPCLSPLFQEGAAWSASVSPSWGGRARSSQKSL